MAKAEKIPADFEVKLTLTREEAETLRAVCHRIAGDPQLSRRKHMDSINSALRNAGIESDTTDISRQREGIYFQG
jgi:hypothetical protein